MAKRYETDRKITVPRFEEAAGFYATATRSRIMSRIKGKNTEPELLLRKTLWLIGIRYRVGTKKLAGRPDILIPRHKIVVFVDGEFWHGHNWEEKKKKIKTNRKFWIAKIERNMQRDRQNNAKLEALGYTVIRFWANEVKSDLLGCIDRVITEITRRG